MKKIIFFVAELFFGAAFLFAGVNLLLIWKEKQANEALYAPLRALISQAAEAGEAYEFPYEELLEQNPDLVG